VSDLILFKLVSVCVHIVAPFHNDYLK